MANSAESMRFRRLNPDGSTFLFLWMKTSWIVITEQEKGGCLFISSAARAMMRNQASGAAA